MNSSNRTIYTPGDEPQPSKPMSWVRGIMPLLLLLGNKQI